MKLGIRQIAFAVVFIAFVGLVQSCARSSPAQVILGSDAKAALPAWSAFKVDSLSISPPEANTGVQVIVTANVTNTGGNEEDYIGELRIDDLNRASLPAFRYSDKVPIGVGETRPLSVLFTMETPGTYKVTWGGLSGEFLVVEADETDAGSNGSTNKTSTELVAPNFTGVDVVTNQKITLPQFKGSMVLLNFVNYGCDPSINNVVSKQLLAIKELTKQRSDFVPVSVFCGCCPPEVLRNFAKENNFNWPWLLDTNNSIIQKYVSYLRRYGYPTLVYINAEQIVKGSSGYASIAAVSEELDEIAGKTN
jgi:hypothetical protein